MLYEQGNPVSEHSDLIGWMYNGHLEKWGLDTDWKILAVEHAPVMWLPTLRGTRSMFRIKMKLDLIVLWNGKIWIVDHKSGKDLPTKKMLDLEDQFGLYEWGLAKMGRRVFGTIHSANRTQRNQSPMMLDERLSRTYMSRTKVELDRIAKEAYIDLREAWRRPVGPETPRHTNSDTCRWRCDFTEQCLQSRKGTDATQLFLDVGFVQNRDRH